MYKVLLLIVSCMLVPMTLSAEEKKAAPAPARMNAQVEQKVKPAPNPITEAAVKAGITSCADRIDQVSNFLTANTQSGWLLFVNKSEPDKRLISASMEVATKEVPTAAYVSESFAPNQASGCASMYETVIFWESACPDVAKKQFSTFKAAGFLSKSITVLDGGATLKVFLMPAGKGCVAIKKEVLQ